VFSDIPYFLIIAAVSRPLNSDNAFCLNLSMTRRGFLVNTIDIPCQFSCNLKAIFNTLLYRPSIRLRLEEIKDRISFKQAIQVLGITKKQLNQVIVEGYFSKTIPPKKDYSVQWLFSSQEISQSLKELFKVASDIQEETVLIADAMRIIGSRIDNPLPKLLKKIKNQEIAVTIANNYRNIKGLAISKRELNNWIQEVTNYYNKYFTIPN